MHLIHRFILIRYLFVWIRYSLYHIIRISSYTRLVVIRWTNKPYHTNGWRWVKIRTRKFNLDLRMKKKIYNGWLMNRETFMTSRILFLSSLLVCVFLTHYSHNTFSCEWREFTQSHNIFLVTILVFHGTIKGKSVINLFLRFSFFLILLSTKQNLDILLFQFYHTNSLDTYQSMHGWLPFNILHFIPKKKLNFFFCLFLFFWAFL